MSVSVLTGRGAIYFEKAGSRDFEGEDTSGTKGIGSAEVYHIRYKTAHVEVLLVNWATGLIDVRPWTVYSGNEAVQSLARGRLRLGISKTGVAEGNQWCELRVARVKTGSEGWSNLINANFEDLRRITGSDPTQLFVNNTGAVQIGTKRDLLKRTDNTRDRVCLVFPSKNKLAPLVAFACTRIMPLEG
jgi:hypothetical protein